MNRRDFQNKNNSSSSKTNNYILPASVLLIGALALGTGYSYFSKEDVSSFPQQPISTQTTTENSHNSVTNNGFINNGIIHINNFFGVEQRNQENLEQKIQESHSNTQPTQSNTQRQTTQANRTVYDFCKPPIATDTYIVDGKAIEIKECDTSRQGSAGDELIRNLAPNQQFMLGGQVYSRQGLKNFADSLRQGEVDLVEIETLGRDSRRVENYVVTPRPQTQTQTQPTNRTQQTQQRSTPTQENTQQRTRVSSLEEEISTNTQNTTHNIPFNGVYHFDITGDGVVDQLRIRTSDNGERLVEVLDGSNNQVNYQTIDSARRGILSDIRFDNVNNSVGPANCYRISTGSQGRDVVRFMGDSNMGSSSLQENGTKFPNLEEYAIFIDTVANCNVRANELVIGGEEGFNLNSENAQAYRMTLGQSVPGRVLALQMGLGSAIYTTYKSDFNPGVQANQAMVTARNGATAMNLTTLEQELSQNGALVNSPISAYNNSQNMYRAQFDVSRRAIENREF